MEKDEEKFMTYTSLLKELTDEDTDEKKLTFNLYIVHTVEGQPISTEDVFQNLLFERIDIEILIHEVIDVADASPYGFDAFGFDLLRIHLQCVLHFGDVTVEHECPM